MGEDELLVSVSDTYTAGMMEVIYGYDPQSDDVRIEAATYVGVSHYSGMLKESAAHNHWYAGEVMWPYSILYYDKEEDRYQKTYYVDAWSKEISDYDSRTQMSYPEEIDTDQDGYVYLITENGQTTYMNRESFQEREAATFLQKELIAIPWENMTAENIDCLC